MPSFIQHLSNTTRSCRRFRMNYPVTRTLMTQWVNNARVTASAANLQPLRYHIATDADECARIFETLSWAGYLKDWSGPAENERPTGYVVIAVDTDVASPEHALIDLGIAAQTIMLGTTEEGFGGCMIRTFDADELKRAIGEMPPAYEPALVLAIGRPIEDIRMVEMPESGEVRYWRDDKQTHFVPKRALEDILF